MTTISGTISHAKMRPDQSLIASNVRISRTSLPDSVSMLPLKKQAARWPPVSTTLLCVLLRALQVCVRYRGVRLLDADPVRHDVFCERRLRVEHFLEERVLRRVLVHDLLRRRHECGEVVRWRLVYLHAVLCLQLDQRERVG